MKHVSETYPTRQYYYCEIPRIGDVIDLIPDSPFGACLVVKVYNDMRCDLVRPHTKLSGNQVTTGYEVVNRINAFNFEVFTTGWAGDISNRCNWD